MQIHLRPSRGVAQYNKRQCVHCVCVCVCVLHVATEAPKCMIFSAVSFSLNYISKYFSRTHIHQTFQFHQYSILICVQGCSCIILSLIYSQKHGEFHSFLYSLTRFVRGRISMIHKSPNYLRQTRVILIYNPDKRVLSHFISTLTRPYVIPTNSSQRKPSSWLCTHTYMHTDIQATKTVIVVHGWFPIRFEAKRCTVDIWSR